MTIPSVAGSIGAGLVWLCAFSAPVVLSGRIESPAPGAQTSEISGGDHGGPGLKAQGSGKIFE